MTGTKREKTEERREKREVSDTEGSGRSGDSLVLHLLVSFFGEAVGLPGRAPGAACAGMIDEARELMSRLLDPEKLQQLLADAGPWVLALVGGIVFAETGLLIGLFLPGDSLLLGAGVVAAKGGFDIRLGLLVATLAAVSGDQLGFWLGRQAGRAVFSRPDGRFIKRKHFEEAHDYYVKNGAKSIVVARFVPVLRTFVPFMAGVAEMPYRNFVFWNIAGGCLWVWSLLGLGYALGSSPWVKHLHHIILAVVIVSVLPVVVGVVKRFFKKAPPAPWK